MNENKYMTIDYQTLSELEILRPEGMGMSVFEIVDRTLTAGGRDLLKSKFKHPPAEKADIENIQETVKFILENRKDFDLAGFVKIMDRVEKYYYSKVDPVVSNNKIGMWFEGMVYQIRSRKFKKTIRGGTGNAIRLVQLIYELYGLLYSKKLPVYLKKMLGDLNSVFQLTPFRQLLSKGTEYSFSMADLYFFDKAFRESHKKEMLHLINFVYEMDTLISRADATRDLSFVFPHFADGEDAVLEIQDVYHLFLKDPVSNTVMFHSGMNFLFLTGPNMAGKTTFLKALAIAVFLAHLGMGVPASSMKLTPFHSLFSSLNASDNLSHGYSYFYSEVLRVKTAAEILSRSARSFMIFDELFKGTNVKDAYDGSLMVIDGLVKWHSGIFILSSHLLELEKEIKKHGNVFFRSFESSVEDGKPRFSFKIVDGVSDERLGLVILKNEQIDRLLDPENQ
jgi:DNA mismatch repair ATPase MutS